MSLRDMRLTRCEGVPAAGRGGMQDKCHLPRREIPAKCSEQVYAAEQIQKQSVVDNQTVSCFMPISTNVDNFPDGRPYISLTVSYELLPTKWVFSVLRCTYHC